MVLSTINVNPTAAAAFTGGTILTYTSMGSGKLANMAAALSSPEYLTIESTLANDSGKDSTYLIKLENFISPPAGSPYNTPDPKLQVHAVIKVDTSVFTEAQIREQCYRLGHILWQPVILQQILRGDR